ncbi:LamG domain-containing protein [Teredinibacter purpureus]|uniref:LamG domain-containing protein n=1 Tax=Teredinibacter purpureus TaxID=2731756 RepID=UPI0005F88CAC|nr:LamG domain-containing protein [Teredinibacter purpureus]
MITLNLPAFFQLHHLRLLSLLAVISVLAACSGGSGETVQQNDDFSRSDGETGVVYNGPSASTDDVQSFKLNLWDNLAGENRCGTCHVQGGTSPEFVRSDDINLAYGSANPLVDLEIPSNSRIVAKVAGGHNCWGTEPAVCAEIITNYIEAWAGAAGTSSNVIVLTAPPEYEVTDSKSFPADSNSFGTTVYPLLASHCASCHSEDSALQQQPYIGSSDIDVAYDAARSKINLDEPTNSRLVTRLANEFHNCWLGGGSCTDNGAEMAGAIADFANAIPITEVDAALVVSHALGLPDGIVAASGGRVENNVIALYEFKNESVETAFDTSGIEPALDLNLTGDVRRVGGWGIRINDGRAQGATSSSEKLYDLIRATGEYSIETWVVPDNVAQDGPARIVTYSGGSEIRNFTVGQTLYNYNFLNRSSLADGNGMPMLSTTDADEVLQATLQHVVTSFNPITGMAIYVNGELVATDESMIGANVNDWDNTFALALGNELDGEYPWQGVVRFLAIHNRSLTADDVQMNFDAGVGEKFFLLFGVSEHIDFPEAYVVFQVEQFDNYSYLFSSPFFISLADGAPTEAIALEGMHIGINGREATIGQSYANINVTIDATNYSGESGVTLSTLGALVELDKGADLDQFFLSFDRIGDAAYVRSESMPPAPPSPADLDEQSDIGLRHFAEIDATIAHLTQTPSEQVPASVRTVYETVRQQLPTVENIDTFLAAHQAGIMQLSVAYCTALVNDTARRARVFDGFNFGDAVTMVNADLIIDPLLTGLTANSIELDGIPTELDTQAAPDDIKTHLYSLIADMSAADTQTTVIALCAATAGSAVMLLQ